MGCMGSKAEESPAVTVCRQRCKFLDEAIRQRYVLAEAHLAYFRSLSEVGFSLRRFFDLRFAAGGGGDGAPSPVLNLPSDQRKGGSSETAAAVVGGGSHSNSGPSHLHFHSDSDEEHDSIQLHSLNSDSSPLHQHESPGSSFSPADYPPAGYPPAGDPPAEYPPSGYMPAGYPPAGYPPVDIPPSGYPPSGYSPTDYQPAGYLPTDYQRAGYPPAGYHPAAYPPAGYPPASYGGYTMNYMRKEPTPAVVYRQRPVSHETIRYGEAPPTSSYYNNNNNYQNLDSYSYNNNPTNYGGFFGSSSQQPPYGGVSHPWKSPAEASSSNTKPPSPPPPPPTSAWDFLNPFQTFETYYPPYTPSLDSREAREEEGIPDLEDEDEVVKEIHGHRRFVDEDGGGDDGGGGDHSKKAVAVDEESDTSSGSELHSELHHRNEPNVDDPVEYEVHVVDNVVDDNDKNPVEFLNDSDVVREIQAQFDRASESGNELAKILEVGKAPYNRKRSAYQVPSKMRNAFAPSLPTSASKNAMVDPSNAGSTTRSQNISSTLHKLYLWEKKLFEEVKVEEKTRLLHDENNRRLRRLDEKGAEPHKIDATRVLVRSLSTKIRVGIQMVDKISEKINGLRDAELWPQLHDFIRGFTSMWRSMVECHRSQCRAIGAARRLDAVVSRKHLDDESLEATLRLEHGLLNWAVRFSCWFGAQRGFVSALNNWLLKCLLYVPEETPDGPVPFSPSRIGAPIVFVVCNQWAQAVDVISDKDVVESVRGFATTILELWERDAAEMRRRTVVHENAERRVRDLEREERRVRKELQALDTRLVLASGDGPEPVKSGGGLQAGLERVFVAVEEFASGCLKAYGDLLQRVEEDRVHREQEKGS